MKKIKANKDHILTSYTDQVDENGQSYTKQDWNHYGSTAPAAPQSKIPPSSSKPTPSVSESPKQKSAPAPSSKTSPPPKVAQSAPAPALKRQTNDKTVQAGQGESNNTSGGIDPILIQIGIIAAAVIIFIIIVVTLYRRYRTRKDYNESPQNFPHKPSLGLKEEYHLNDCKVQACYSPQSITIQQRNEVIGKGWRVQFRGTQKSAVYFHRRQNTTAYFEIELLAVNGSVEMGYVPVNCFDKIKSGEESIGNSGVGITNAGYVQAQGENLYNYGWTLIYGDVFGMGLTRQNSKFSQRRGWISKNGALMNTPPNEELGRWLATIEISAQQKAEYNLQTQKKDEEEQSQAEQQDEQKMKEKAQRQKIEGILKKQRISLKTFNAFEYYPVVYFYGNKNDSRSTVININVGGQVFRMFDAQFRSGLLKDKALFGDD